MDLPNYGFENSAIYKHYLCKLIYHLSQSEGNPLSIHTTDPSTLKQLIEQEAIPMLHNFIQLDPSSQTLPMLGLQNLSKKGFEESIFSEFPSLFQAFIKDGNLSPQNKVELAKTIAELATHNDSRRKIISMNGFYDAIRDWSAVNAADKSARQLRLQTAILVGNLAENCKKFAKL